MFDLDNPKLIETTNNEYLLKNYPMFEIRSSDVDQLQLIFQLASHVAAKYRADFDKIKYLELNLVYWWY